MNIFQQNKVEVRLCSAVNVAIRNRDAVQLQSIVIIEPEFPADHLELIQSLKDNYPQGDSGAEKRLEELVRRVVTESEESEDADGRPLPGWGSLVTFLVQWMTFLRDVEPDSILEVYKQLSELLQLANSALQHPTKGILMLPTIVGYSKVFARVALGLEKFPELIDELVEESVNEEGQRESLPEKAANVVRQAFTTCLNDRNTVPGGVKDGRPDGKKIGIYKMANICLRILLQADKPESCNTIFNNIMNSSPPLGVFPASERVTFLYFLGRYHFAHGNFYQALLALQEAWDHCTSADYAIKQRRLILIYLVGSNVILGRFPSRYIYDLPEAHGLKMIFAPLVQAIRRGDLETFRRITNLDGSHPSAGFLMKNKMFYPIGTYCEVLVWRSLARKVFLLTGSEGQQNPNSGVSEIKSSSIPLDALLHAFRFYEHRAKIKNPAMSAQNRGPGRSNTGHLFFDHASTTKSTYIDPDFEGAEGLVPYNHEISPLEVECICGSLIIQGFLKGYISQQHNKVAVSGANKPGGALKFGFPRPWDIIKSENSDEVQGWKKVAGDQGGGQVVRLSGARPAGS